MELRRPRLCRLATRVAGPMTPDLEQARASCALNYWGETTPVITLPKSGKARGLTLGDVEVESRDRAHLGKFRGHSAKGADAAMYTQFRTLSRQGRVDRAPRQRPSCEAGFQVTSTFFFAASLQLLK